MIQEIYVLPMFFLPVGVAITVNLLISQIFKDRDKDAVLVIRWCCVLSSFILGYFSSLITLFLLISLVFFTAFLESRKSGNDNALMEFYKFVHGKMGKKAAAGEAPSTSELEN